MFFSLKSDCYFRRYENIGYIIRPIISIEEVVNKTGAFFLDELTYSPQSLDDIVERLKKRICNVPLIELKQDVSSFYFELVENGFLNYSEKLQDFRNDGFEYATLEGKLAYKTIKSSVEEKSSDFLVDYFKEHPHLQTFHVEVTSKCNERCIHCYIPHENKTSDINTDFMINVIDQCKEMGVLTIVFSGGEPLLHPDFCKLLRYTKDLDFNVTVLSNLTLLNDEILAGLMYKHASCVNVSLYSMKPEIHDMITTVKGSHEKTKQNILRLIEHNVPVQINCPVMKQNIDSFYEVVKWGQEHKCSVNVDYLIIARSDHSTDNLNNRISIDDLKDVIKLLAENDVVFQQKILKYKVNREAEKNINADSRVCGVGMSTLCMISTGEVYPCAGWQGYICGNLKKDKLKDIWNNAPEVKYLRELRLKDFKKCVDCKDYKYCLMCMGRNANEDPCGDIFNIPEITCEAARIQHQVVESYR